MATYWVSRSWSDSETRKLSIPTLQLFTGGRKEGREKEWRGGEIVSCIIKYLSLIRRSVLLIFCSPPTHGCIASTSRCVCSLWLLRWQPTWMEKREREVVKFSHRATGMAVSRWHSYEYSPLLRIFTDQGRVLLHTSQLEGVWQQTSTNWWPRTALIPWGMTPQWIKICKTSTCNQWFSLSNPMAW